MGNRWGEEFPRRNLGGPTNLYWCKTCERWCTVFHPHDECDEGNDDDV